MKGSKAGYKTKQENNHDPFKFENQQDQTSKHPGPMVQKSF